MKEKIINIFHKLNYIEWACSISLFILIIMAIITLEGDLFAFIIGAVIYTFIVAGIAGAHDIRYIDDNRLYKYKPNYRIFDITIDEKTYYFPVISILTKYGGFFEYIIKEQKNEEKTMTYFLTSYDTNDINDGIKRDYRNITRYLDKDLCYEKQEDASYVIAQCEQYISKQKKIRDNIKKNDINISFKR